MAKIDADEVLDPAAAAWAETYVAAGRLVPGIACVVVAPESLAAEPPPNAEAFSGLRLGSGAIGEILVSGPLVIRGRMHGRGDAETKVRVGERICRTGDAEIFDDTGRLWLAGSAAGYGWRKAGRITSLRRTLLSRAPACDGQRSSKPPVAPGLP